MSGLRQGRAPGEPIEQLAIAILASRGSGGPVAPRGRGLAQGRRPREGLSHSPPTAAYVELVGNGIDKQQSLVFDFTNIPFPSLSLS